MKEIIQFKILLVHSKPEIWRRLQIETKRSFKELHHALQITMGWNNMHLFEFSTKDYRIGIPNGGFEEFANIIDAKTVNLASFELQENEELVYDYDFGDGWRHQLVVEKYLDKEVNTTYPRCIEAKNNCPPEDSGGIPGFYNLLEVLQDPEHPELEELVDWLGGEYDATAFDVEEANEIFEDFENYVMFYERENK